MSEFWRHFKLALARRGPYDPTGRDQVAEELREQLRHEREMRVHFERRLADEVDIVRTVARIVGHRLLLPEEHGRVRSREEFYAHVRSLMSHLDASDVAQAQIAADEVHRAARATLYADATWVSRDRVLGAEQDGGAASS